MFSRFRFLLFLGALLFGGWPASLLANVPVQPLKPPPQLPPQKPSTSSFLLIASHKLKDTWFRESVVLATQTGHRGPVGIIINRPQDITLDKIFPVYPAARDFRLFAGGPVNPGQISYLFRSNEAVAGALKVSEHTYIANDMTLLRELLSGARAHNGLRVAKRLAGWAPGQLENEIAHGDWYVLPINDTIIFDRPVADIWPELSRQATTISH